MATDKSQSDAVNVAVQGRKWIEVSFDLTYGYHGQLQFSGDIASITGGKGKAQAELCSGINCWKRNTLARFDTSVGSRGRGVICQTTKKTAGMVRRKGKRSQRRQAKFQCELAER
ncbi:hypothetical protein [Oceaniglobus ichthyenteri]|uniref:hypothetical protein n=1 Tax=Oceaniglobus ichthyenteri TaxID=2136177 RepID=UPI000F8361E7|nr:hypothetical protein [Oceaniglobus ichthyenteri]